MNRSKLYFPLSIAILALLIGLTSLAQAAPKKPNPGHDNPGTETAYVAAGFGVIANTGESCASRTRMCEDYARAAFPYYVDGGDLDSFSYAYADWDLSCRAAASANAYGEVWVIGGGILELNRHGYNGSMHHIEFLAGLASSTALWVDARTHADALAAGEVFAIGGVADAVSACDSVTGTEGGGDIGPRVLETCGELAGYNFGIGGGWAEASSTADAFAGAGSNSLFAAGAWTQVYAANIESFKSVVAGGASNYVYAQAGAQVDVWTEAFVGDFMATYFSACADADITPPGAYVQICADGGSAALALAYARAATFAQAQARALAETHFTAVIPALYENLNGTEDNIYIGAFGAGGAQGNVATRCVVPTPN